MVPRKYTLNTKYYYTKLQQVGQYLRVVNAISTIAERSIITVYRSINGSYAIAMTQINTVLTVNISWVQPISNHSSDTSYSNCLNKLYRKTTADQITLDCA